MKIIGMIILSGGVWVLQDSIASVLYYLKRDDEKWYFNHAVRILRACWGIAFIICGVYIICG